MYVSICYFERGVFTGSEDPFFSKKAFDIYDKAVMKYSKLNKEVIIALRNDDHTLVKAWGTVKEPIKFAVRLKEAKKKG